jgi:multicomponent Na+:H+ antiporter subunit B
VLASYRGFDTLGEVTVIFTVAVAVLLLIGGRRSKPAVKTKDEGEQDEA